MNKEIKSDKKSRRKFIFKEAAFAFFGIAAIGTGWFRSLKKSTSKQTGDSVKMLTEDGQLVEVDKQYLEQLKNKKRTDNNEILKWSKVIKTKS